MPTIEALQRAIKQAKEHKQFHEWSRPLEEQILNLAPGRGKFYWLWWMADVSNGCKQAFTIATTQII